MIAGEKFYNDEEWLIYLIEHFFKENALAKKDLPLLQCNHSLNGQIHSQGEEPDDTSLLEVKNNNVKLKKCVVAPVGKPTLINEETLLSGIFSISQSMSIITNLKITGLNSEQKKSIEENDTLNVPIPDIFRDRFHFQEHFSVFIKINNDSLTFYNDGENPIVESIYLIYQHLFNENYDGYNSCLDMKNTLVDGDIEIKNTYYEGTIMDDIHSIISIANNLFIHKGKMIAKNKSE